VIESGLELPARWAQRHTVDGNSARQRAALPSAAVIEQDGHRWFARVHDAAAYEIRERGRTPPGETALEIPRSALESLPGPIDIADLRWISSERCTDPAVVLDALAGRFALRTEDPGAGTRGLRIPQAGAVHAVLAHWSTGTTEPATIVMPTGTGKTETMLALFASERLARLLVLVPSDNLRSQIAEVFETYGILADVGVLDAPAIGPVVGRIEHHFASTASIAVEPRRTAALSIYSRPECPSSFDPSARQAERDQRARVDISAVRHGHEMPMIPGFFAYRYT